MKKLLTDLKEKEEGMKRDMLKEYLCKENKMTEYLNRLKKIFAEHNRIALFGGGMGG